MFCLSSRSTAFSVITQKNAETANDLSRFDWNAERSSPFTSKKVLFFSLSLFLSFFFSFSRSPTVNALYPSWKLFRSQRNRRLKYALHSSTSAVRYLQSTPCSCKRILLRDIFISTLCLVSSPLYFSSNFETQPSLFFIHLIQIQIFTARVISHFDANQ